MGTMEVTIQHANALHAHGKENHLRSASRSGRKLSRTQIQKGRPVHEVQQPGDEDWQSLDDKD